MENNQTITHSKPEKLPSILQAYDNPGVQIPAPYFIAPVTSGHSHPYMWSPQPMLTPFGSPYTAIYPHAGLYYHPSATQTASALNAELPVMPSTTKQRGPEKKTKVPDNPASSNSGNAKVAGSNGNEFSESADNVEGSSDGSDLNSESGVSERKMIKCREVLPNSASDATPTISLGLSVAPVAIAGTLCTVFQTTLTSGMDQNSSCVSKLKSGGEQNLPTRIPVEKELKREKRKQSNRESARRSRLRRLAEAEELSIKFGILTAENSTLRSEIRLLTQSSDKLRLENVSLMNKLAMAPSSGEDSMVPDKIIHDAAPSIMIENFLSKIDGCGNQPEAEPSDNSGGNAHQFLDLNPLTGSMAAS